MSELKERQWAVLSERGCEAASLAYVEAVQLVSRLSEEKVYGLCIITDEAARRSTSPQSSANPSHPSNNSNQKARK
jgi:hypothetical protein